MYENLSKKLDLNREFNDALFSWDIDKIKVMFSDEVVNKPDINRDLVSAPAILISAIHKKWDMFELLYTLDADLDVKSIGNDWHLIHECVKNAPLDITKTMIEYCDLNVKTEDGKTPFMIAIKEKNATVSNLLLETKRLKLDLYDDKGDNAAHYAARSGMNELFLALIKEGVPLNKKNKQGKYPADLIQDEFFKKTVPDIESRVVRAAANVEKASGPQSRVEEADKPIGLSGLSTIKKKF